MSYTTVFKIQDDGQVVEAFRQQNSFSFAPVIWTFLWDKYVRTPEDPSWSSWMLDAEKLWRLDVDPRLARAERVALFTTFDRVWVPRERIPEVVESLKATGDCHLLGLYDLKAAQIRGVCFYGTSAGQNLWEKRGRGREGQLINIDKDRCFDRKKPWNMFEELERIEKSLAAKQKRRRSGSELPLVLGRRG